MALLLMQKGEAANATITVCHSRTKDLPAVAGNADILVAAVGRAEFVKGAWIKPGAVVIDVGVNRVDDSSRKRGYRLVGDVDFDAVKEKASLITPVPGGVGPLTNAILLTHLMRAARDQATRQIAVGAPSVRTS